jgi:separase
LYFGLIFRFSRSENQSQNDIFLYFGHGSGEKLYSIKDSQIQQQQRQQQQEKKPQFPASFLWGCSSLRLKTRGFHESNGPLFTLIEKGSPFVVGNLWDVTDRDLDRLSIDCLEKYFMLNEQKDREECDRKIDERMKLSNILSTSRKVCKLPYAVGCAPVIYGLPLPCS